MPVPAAPPAAPPARRSRHLIPAQIPRRSELVAAIATLAVLAHVLLAQLTLILAIVFRAISRISGWRPGWLAVPAGAGLVWALAIGPGAALTGLAQGPRRVAGYFAGAAGSPGRILHPEHAFAGAWHWLPAQFPLALILAAAEAGVAYWLDMLHADERASNPRPGLIVASRRRWTTAAITAGSVATRDGGCLGVNAADGSPAAISWAEAEGGVLCTGTAGSLTAGGPDDLLARTCFLLVHAAIRRRKPVIVIDLAGRDWISPALAAACADAEAPLRSFAPEGPGYYEPLRGGDPAQAAALVTSILDWAGAAGQRRAGAGYLTAAFGVLAAAPSDPHLPVLDDLAGLLSPAALRARLGRVPGYHPRRAALAEHVGLAASQADPAALAPMAAQLAELRGSALGRWLGPGQARISVGQAVRDRAVAEFRLAPVSHNRTGHSRAERDGPRDGARQDWARQDSAHDWASHDWASWDRPARMIASLAAGDLIAVCAELGKIGVPSDALAWVHGCEAVDQALLRRLVDSGAAAGLAVMLSTESAGLAAQLAGAVNVVVACGPDGLDVARRYSGLEPAAAGPNSPESDPGPASAAAAYPLPARAVRPPRRLASRAAPDGSFAVVVKHPRRVIERCDAVISAGLAGRK